MEKFRDKTISRGILPAGAPRREPANSSDPSSSASNHSWAPSAVVGGRRSGTTVAAAGLPALRGQVRLDDCRNLTSPEDPFFCLRPRDGRSARSSPAAPFRPASGRPHGCGRLQTVAAHPVPRPRYLFCPYGQIECCHLRFAHERPAPGHSIVVIHALGVGESRVRFPLARPKDGIERCRLFVLRRIRA